MSKIESALRIYRQQGFSGIAWICQNKAKGAWVRKSKRLSEATARIDDCQFKLDTPLLQESHKIKLLTGEYEEPERIAIKRFLDAEIPVVELGGAIGVVSCLTNKKLKSPTRHVVVEANPKLVPLLEANRDANNCRFKILNAMVGYDGAESDFYVDDDFLASSAVSADAPRDDKVTLKTVSLESILDKNGFASCSVICDIEGGEADLIRREAEVFRRRVKMIVLEVHPKILGEETVSNLLKDLESFGFRRKYKFFDTFAFENSLLTN